MTTLLQITMSPDGDVRVFSEYAGDELDRQDLLDRLIGPLQDCDYRVTDMIRMVSLAELMIDTDPELKIGHRTIPADDFAEYRRQPMDFADEPIKKGTLPMSFADQTPAPSAFSDSQAPAPAVQLRRKSPPYEGPNPELARALVLWRRQKAREMDVPPYFILHQRVLYAIADAWPTSIEELQQVQGIGPKTCERYGEEILNALNV